MKESDLEREFGRFGPIERVCNLPYHYLGFSAGYANSPFQIRIVRSKDPNSKKPHRGYAFIVYEREKDMKGIDTLPPPCFAPHLPSSTVQCHPYMHVHQVKASAKPARELILHRDLLVTLLHFPLPVLLALIYRI